MVFSPLRIALERGLAEKKELGKPCACEYGCAIKRAKEWRGLLCPVRRCLAEE